MYYNTNQRSGQELLNLNVKALSLKERVLKLFQKEQKPMNWSEVKKKIGKVNESSLKRSISDLKKEGILEKTNELVPSIYEAASHKYKLRAA